MHFISSFLNSARAILTNDQAKQISEAIDEGRCDIVHRHLQAQNQLTADDFSKICFHMPHVAELAIRQYPELVKNAPFSLLTALARKSTHQEPTYHTRPVSFDPTPTTEETLIRLIDAGAPIHGKDPITGYTLLHLALENGLAAAAERLILHGIDDTIALPSGVTALHMAAQDGYKYKKALELLAHNKNTLHKTTRVGATALHYAAKANSLDAVDMLLEAGAKRDVKDVFGLTPLDITKEVDKNFFVLSRLSRTDAGYALVKHYPARVIKFLKQGDTVTDDDAATSCVGNTTSCLMQVIQGYPDVVKCFSDTLLVRLLHHWPSDECCEICTRLIELGIGVNGKHPETGQTALHVALKSGRIALAKKLIENKATLQGKEYIDLSRIKEPQVEFDAVELLLTAENINNSFSINETHYKEANLLQTPPTNYLPADLTPLKGGNNGATTFIDKVTNETPFLGTAKKGTRELHDFYRIIRNALRAVVLELQAPGRTGEEKKSMFDNIVRRLDEASGECAAQYLATALDLYNTYVMKITPNMSSALLEQLQILREIVVETITDEPWVNKQQTAHAIGFIKKTLGQRIGLRNFSILQPADILASSGFCLFTKPSELGLYIAFKKRYTPFVVCEYVADLMSDERYRNFYIDWAKKNLKKIVPGYKAYCQKKSQLDKQVVNQWFQTEKSIATKRASLKEERRAEIVSWLFHENSFKPKIVPILFALKKLNVIENNILINKTVYSTISETFSKKEQ